MTDPGKQPGLFFDHVRLLRAEYELSPEAPNPPDGELDLDYGDHVTVEAARVLVRQRVSAKIHSPAEPERIFLRASVEVEGLFLAGPDTNISLDEFGQNHAPALLLAFTREWLHRLTSAAKPWPPILIPPLNVLEIRKRRQSPAK